MRLSLCCGLLLVSSADLPAQSESTPEVSAPAASASSPAPANRAAARTWARFAALSAQTLKRAAAEPTDVPAPLAELPELAFKDFFGPIGPGGLEYSTKIRALAGQRIRVKGFMVQQSERTPGLFLLTAAPLKVDTRADCNDTDTPPAMIHVLVPGAAKALPFVPGPHVLSGILELGARAEADERISVARLRLDDGARADLFGPSSDPAPLAGK